MLSKCHGAVLRKIKGLLKIHLLYYNFMIVSAKIRSGTFACKFLSRATRHVTIAVILKIYLEQSSFESEPIFSEMSELLQIS